VKGLGHLDKFPGMARCYSRVKASYGTCSHYIAPIGILFENFVQLGIVPDRRNFFRIADAGILKQEPVEVGDDIPMFKISGRRKQRTVESISVTVEIID
jgi:hypothetical protein